uniref:Mos1 transposase HTH domain-containing protein n=1 Tax=Acrobeloides nanus TaxID=290746 RepID=A0A914C923_9BILA
MKDEIFIHKAKHLDDLSASTTKYSNKKTQLTAKLQELCQIVNKLYEQFNDVKLKFIDARENGLKPLDELTEEYFQYQKKVRKAVIQRELCAQEFRTIIKESVENYIDNISMPLTTKNRDLMESVSEIPPFLEEPMLAEPESIIGCTMYNKEFIFLVKYKDMNYKMVIQNMKKHLRHVLLWLFDKDNLIKNREAAREIQEVYGNGAITEQGFWVKGIVDLPRRWAKVIEYEGDYFPDD